MVKRYNQEHRPATAKKIHAGFIFRDVENRRAASNDWNGNTQCERGFDQQLVIRAADGHFDTVSNLASDVLIFLANR